MSHTLTIADARAKLDSKELSSVELTQAVLDRIAATDEKLGAFLALATEDALAAASVADEKIAAGKSDPLTGIPIGIKDTILTRGLTTTAASKMLENFVPPYDATVVAKLREAGAIIVGKTNCDEFAMGTSTESSAFQKTHNPWDLDRVPGGSSGGSAAAVAADQVIAALGSDTGGSIRQPASFSGCVGLKPTYGRVSRYGLVALASSLDSIGPLTKTVRDAATILGVLAGLDPHDATSAAEDIPDYTATVDDGISGLTIGVPREYFASGLRPEVRDAVQAAISQLEKLGANVVEVTLPHTRYTVPAYYIILPAEASANLARYDGIRYGHSVMREEDATTRDLLSVYLDSRGQGFGPEVKRRIMLGTYALSSGYYDAYYKKAQQVRTLIRRDFDEAFQKVDLLVTPATPDIAFKLGEKSDDPLKLYAEDIYTSGANLAGLPAVSLPCGQVDGLPVGLQIIGPAFAEARLLQAAYAYEQATDWHAQHPDL